MNIFFIDIETARESLLFTDLPIAKQELWNTMCTRYTLENNWENAGLHPEFSKIVCISIAFFVGEEIRMKSLTGEEVDILSQLSGILKNSPDYVLCGHNIKEFDIPFICRRMVINNMAIPRSINGNGKKPWEVTHLDTKDMWKFGAMRGSISLNLMAYLLGIESPKDDISGADVARVFYEGDIGRIATYCEKDVMTVISIYKKIRPLIFLT